jgi:hypothetical protein
METIEKEILASSTFVIQVIYKENNYSCYIFKFPEFL